MAHSAESCYISSDTSVSFITASDHPWLPVINKEKHSKLLGHPPARITCQAPTGTTTQGQLQGPHRPLQPRGGTKHSGGSTPPAPPPAHRPPAIGHRHQPPERSLARTRPAWGCVPAGTSMLRACARSHSDGDARCRSSRFAPARPRPQRPLLAPRRRGCPR